MLTDRKLKTLKVPTKGRTDVWDTGSGAVRGLGVRITDTGRKVFMLMCRYPGSKNPVRRTIGEYPSMSLADARQKAGEWRTLVRQGKDPADEEERRQRAEERRRENSFAAVAEKFIEYIHRQKLRTAAVMEKDLRQTFVAKWRARPITEITADDVKRVIRQAVEREATYQAFSDFALVRRLFFR